MATLLAQLYPDLTLWLAVGLAAFWVVSLLVWLFLRIVALQSEVDSLKTKSSEKQLEKPTLGSLGWKILEEMDLFLDGWQATGSHHLEKGETIRVTASGNKRFKVHLSSIQLSVGGGKRRFTPQRSSPETKSWTGTWDIGLLDPPKMAIVIAPSGSSPF